MTRGIHRGSIIENIPGNLARDWALSKEQPSLQTGGMNEEDILEWMDIDLVLAFPGGKGTQDMVRKAKDKGLWVKEVKDDNQSLCEPDHSPRGYGE